MSRLSLCPALALLCALVCTSPAAAATQTQLDPTEAYPADFGRTTDLRAATLDTTSQPGKLLITSELEFSDDKRLTGVIYLDTDSDFKADYAVELPYNESRHPKLDGTPGAVGFHLRAAEASTTDCQSYSDGIGAFEIANGTVPATRRASDNRTLFTIPIDLAAIGNPATFRWALITQSSFFDDGGPVFYYDFLPDAANGRPELDPRNPPGGEQDEWFCSPRRRRPERRLPRRHEPRARVRRRRRRPSTSRRRSTSSRRRSPHHRDAVRAGRAGQRPRRHRSRATRGTSTTTACSTTATRRAASQTFPTAGPHHVGVRVIDNGGLSAFSSLTVDVQRRPPTLTVTVSKVTPSPGSQSPRPRAIFSDAPYDPAAIEWGFDSNNNGDDLRALLARPRRSLPVDLRAARRLHAQGAPSQRRRRARDGPPARQPREQAADLPRLPDPRRSGCPTTRSTPTRSCTASRSSWRRSSTTTAPSRPRVDWDLDGDGVFDEAVRREVRARVRDRRDEEDRGAHHRRRRPGRVRQARRSRCCETATSACGGTAGSDGIRAVGCFRPDPVTPTTKISQQPIKVNGLDLVPEERRHDQRAAGGVLFIQRQRRRRDQGRARCRCSRAASRWTPTASRPRRSACSGIFYAPVFARLKGFPLKGDVDVYLTPEGTLVNVDVDVFSRSSGASPARPSC